ncbi:TolC family protein [Aquirufa regiilacus]|uniref:TolC family protein n=1 Tax=Aquirufa regiilacus TaxID=3024868 RepID=A0ABU3TRU9_9BACT|nr:TolC family protein [Aquirufa sp. LEOWEIH-7C]MDU0808589.1 TolC family protein [Aquirufa sp. LEOWEIH-7C]
MSIKKYLSLTLLAGLSWGAHAQTAIQGNASLVHLSLSQAVDIALQHNLTVKSYEVNLKNAELTYQQAKYNQLPSLGGNINQAASFGRSINPYTNGYDSRNINYNNVGLNANLTLFNGGQLRNTILQNEFALKATQQDLQSMRENIALQVVLSYLSILNAEDQLSIAQAQTEITKLQIDRTQKLVTAGTLPVSNVLDLKAQLANEESNVVSFQSSLDINKLTLQQLLNDSSIRMFDLQRIQVPVPSSKAYDLSVDAIYAKALEIQPLVRAADFRVQGASKGVAVAKAFRLPTLSMSGSWSANQSNALRTIELLGTQTMNLGSVAIGGTSYPVSTVQPKYGEGSTVGYFDQLNNTQNKVISLNLNIPIFAKYANRTRVVQAGLQKENAEIEAERARLTLRQNIEQAYVNMVNAANKYEASSTQVSALEESFRASESRFNAGTIDFVSYNLQKTNLDKARLALIQVKYDFVFRTKILDYYQGKSLTF